MRQLTGVARTRRTVRTWAGSLLPYQAGSGMLGICADNKAAWRGNGSSQSGLPVQSRQPEALLEVQMHQMRQSDILGQSSEPFCPWSAICSCLVFNGSGALEDCRTFAKVFCEGHEHITRPGAPGARYSA